MLKNLILAVALTLGASSCLGPHKITTGLWEWNNEVSDNEWVNEAVFLGCNIIPVYGVAYFADVVVLNTIAYWTGDAPIEDPGAFPAENFTN